MVGQRTHHQQAGYINLMPETEPAMNKPSTSRPTLFFVHGWCGNQALWQPQVDYFTKHYRVVTLDLGGHGQSGEERTDWSITSFAEEVTKRMVQQKLHDVVLLGHSMGGAVCVEAATLRPDLVRAVVLLDTFIFDYGHFEENEITQTLAEMKTSLRDSIFRIVRATIPPSVPDDKVNSIASVMAITRPEVAVPAFESLLRWDLVGFLPSLQVPLYAINSDKINPKAKARYKSAIKETVMEGVGHFLHLEKPEAFNRTLDKVLAAIEQEPSPDRRP